jgi:hypothetical protein
MDKLSSLNLSFDRVLIQLIIPGLIAIFPWFLLFINSHYNANSYFHNNSTITITTLTFLALIAGLLLENFGGRIEIMWFDVLNKRKDPNYMTIWNKFLQLNYDGKEPIGHRYIRNIVLRMKFELSAGIALIPMSVGLEMLHKEKNIFSNGFIAFLVIYLVPWLIAIYIVVIEARSSSKVLAETRKLLVEKYFV